MLKLHKKQLVLDRQVKNRKQQQQKVVPKKIDKDILKLAKEAEEAKENTDDDHFEAIFSQLNKEKTVIKTQPKNQKITFPEDEGFADFDLTEDGLEEVMETDSHTIQVKNLFSMNRSKDIGTAAKDFLQEHFYGNRLRRETALKSKISKKNLKIRKRSSIGKRSKVL